MQSIFRGRSPAQIHLFWVPLLAGLTFGSGIVAAQEEDLEEITVTGSRLARDPNLGAALPIQSIGSEQIQLSGEFSITDVLNDIPALLSSTTSESSIDSADFSDGANILNLRGLGANRTLVLVNGRRHVGGVQGSGAVDVGSIPTKLIERVEVLTGGASAVYGADAVTGVVNFILKDDYEGFGFDANYGLSSNSDGAQTSLTATWGTNFADDRGNFVVSVDYRTDDGVKVTDRRNGALIGSGRDWVNPALRFQQGDISAANTPNFDRFYNFDNTGLTNFGLPIPGLATDFLTAFNAAAAGFGAATIGLSDLTPAELALIDQAATAPRRAVLPGRTFPFTSGYGMIIPGNPFTFAGFDPAVPIDLDGNGNPDCLDSFTGYNSVFGAESFGVVGGCWNVNESGQYAPVQDGLVAGNFQGFGGDSFNTIQNKFGNILLPDDKVSVNLLGHFDVNDRVSVFGELKYVTQETKTGGGPNSFWDLLFGAADNPFLPEFIQPVAAATGGVAITIDPLVFDSFSTTERDTTRAVLGLEGAFNNGWNYEVSATYGKFEQSILNTNRVINDRFFAAIDAVTDPATGQPACRADVDSLAPPLTTPFNIPNYDPGFFSFTPGSGQCQPLNIWAGRTGVTQAARDFVLTDELSKLELEQLVFSAYVSGDSSDWFELPAGVVSFAVGAEFRDESSNATFDPFQRGVIPAGAPFAAGTNIADVSSNGSLTFRPSLAVKNESGSYDVADIFFEASIPLLIDAPLARELTLDVAARFSDYSTIGRTATWKANMVYTPINSLSFRGTVSEAVRAPNITELFGPQIGATFRPNDPCDIAQLDAIREDDPSLANQTQANCEAAFAAIGIDPTGGTGTYNFEDPLSAAFGGLNGGNRDLTEETAETVTVGFVFQPEFVQGLSLTVDYWNISIDDAISTPSSQDLVNGCYQGPTLNTNFCDFFTRNPDPSSAQAGGFNFLRTSSINFAKVDTSGYDFALKYQFDVGAHGFDATVQGTKVNEIDFFTNPADLTDVNPELGEINRPKLAGNVFLNWTYGDFLVGWQAQYMDKQLLGFVESQTAQTLYGPSVIMDEFWQHDLSARYSISDEVFVYGGIKNVTAEDPFITNRAFPSSPRGRFFFFGVNWQI